MFLCQSLVAAQSKEELIKRATDLQQKLENDIQKVQTIHPNVGRVLEGENRALKLLIGELQTATHQQVIQHLEQRLDGLENRVQQTLKQVGGGF